MAVSDDRKYTKSFVHTLLEGVKGKTLGEVDSSHQFARTKKSEKITGIAGDVIEQSVFGYERDSKQECDIEIDGGLTIILLEIMHIFSTNSQNSLPIFLIQKTNHTASLLCGQTNSLQNYRQTSALTSKYPHEEISYTHARCQGHSSMLGASAPL